MSPPLRLGFILSLTLCLLPGFIPLLAADPSDADTIRLIEALAADRAERERAGDELSRRVPPTADALPELTRLAVHPDPAVRLHVTLMLAELLPPAGLSDRAASRARMAANERAAELLERLHKDPAPAVRAAAVRACMVLPPTRVDLRLGLRDPDAGVRLETIRVLLMRQGGNTTRDDLAAALSDPDPAVRREAAGALGTTNANDTRVLDSVLPRLRERAREDESLGVRVAARTAIQQLEPESTPSLTPRPPALDRLASRSHVVLPALLALVLVGVAILPWQRRTRVLLGTAFIGWVFATRAWWWYAPAPLSPGFVIPPDSTFHVAGFSPDGERFALVRSWPFGEPHASVDRPIVDLVDRTGRTTRLEGRDESLHIPQVQFSSDGSRVLVSRYRHQPFTWLHRLHDTANGRQLGEWEGPSDRGHACLSPTLQRLAFSRAEGLGQVWDTGTNRRGAGFDGLGDPVAFSASGQLLLSGLPGDRPQAPGEGPPATLWDADTGGVRVTLIGTRGCAGWRFSPDGSLLVGLDPFAQGAALWETSTGRKRCQLQGSTLTQRLSFSPDGRFVVGVEGSGNPSLRLWEVGSGGERFSLSRVTGFAFTPDGQALLCVGVVPGPEVPSLSECDLTTLSRRDIRQFQPGVGVVLGGLPASSTVAVIESGRLRILDRGTGMEYGTVRNFDGPVHLSPDGRTVVVMTRPRTTYGQTFLSSYDVSSPARLLLASLGFIPVWTLGGVLGLLGLGAGIRELRRRRQERIEAGELQRREERFTRLLRQGSSEALHRYLEGHPDSTPAQLAAVLRIDQAERWRKRQPRLVADYLREHPEIAGDPALVFELLLGECEAARVAGVARSPEEVAAGFPELAERLRERTAVDATVQTDAPQFPSSPPRSSEQRRLLETLDPLLRVLAGWQLDGVEMELMAARLGCAVCTVERKLARIRRAEKAQALTPTCADGSRYWLVPVLIAAGALAVVAWAAWM